MKRAMRFLLMLLFPSHFIHQAYTYETDEGRSMLAVEFVVFGKDCCANVELGLLAWSRALWKAAA